MSESASFRASFPPVLSAIRMAGDGGMRIMLDIPESDMSEALKLLMWRGVVVKVTVEPEKSWTDLDCEAEKDPEGSGHQVGGRRVAIRRN